MVNDEVCGAVVSVRYQEDIISVWNRTASDQATTTRIRDTLKRVLNLPPNTILEYKVSIALSRDLRTCFVHVFFDYCITTNHITFYSSCRLISPGSRRLVEI